MIQQKRHERKKQRPTAKQVGQAIDLFRPSPKFDANVTGLRLTPDCGNLRAFVNVELVANGYPFFLLRGVRIVRQQDQMAYAQMPCQQSKRDGKYYPIAKSLDPDLTANIKRVALNAYEEATNGIQIAMQI